MIGFSIGFLITGIMYMVESIDAKTSAKCVICSVTGIIYMILAVAIFVIRHYI